MSSDTLRRMSVAQLRQKLKENDIPVPTKGSGKNGAVLKDDLIGLLRSQKRREIQTSGVGMRDYLPNEMVMDIALRTPEDAIGALCRTDKNLRLLCHDVGFWKAYFSTHEYGTLLKILLSGEDDTSDYELFRWLWKNGESFGSVKDNTLYKQLVKKINDIAKKKGYRSSNKELSDFLLYMWKYAPLSERSRFYPEVVENLNNFLKRWAIIPKIEGVEDFYFRKRIPDNAEELGIDYDDDIYYQYTQGLEEDEEAAEEFKQLSELVLFTGEYYELIRPLYFFVGPGPGAAEIKTHDKVSRGFIPNTNQTVGQVLQQMAYVGFDPIKEITEKAGAIEFVEIDEEADYPTLIVNFEFS